MNIFLIPLLLTLMFFVGAAEIYRRNKIGNVSSYNEGIRDFLCMRAFLLSVTAWAIIAVFHYFFD